MTKYLLTILLGLCVTKIAIGQDQITRVSGDIVNCEIIYIDSSKIEFLVDTKSKKNLQTYLETSEISFFKYNGNEYNLNVIDKRELNYIQDKSDLKTSDLFYADSIQKNYNCFAYTYTNKIIHGRNVTYERPKFGLSYMHIDNKKIRSDNVKFYKNINGFYANSKSIYSIGSTIFAKRISDGKINLYEVELRKFNPTYYDPMTNSWGGGFNITRIRQYYNFRFDDIKKANYKNLSIELIDNPESVKYLNKYKQVHNLENTFYIVGGGVLLAGLVGIIFNTGKDSSEPTNLTGEFIAIGAGVVTICIAYYIGLSKPKHLRRAVYIYNR